MPARNDGQQRERDHAVYSARQRTVVLTFLSAGEAEAFDALTDDEVAELLASVFAR